MNKKAVLGTTCSHTSGGNRETQQRRGLAGFVPRSHCSTIFLYTERTADQDHTFFSATGGCMRLTNEQREQVITLRRKHSLSEVASLAGLSGNGEKPSSAGRDLPTTRDTGPCSPCLHCTKQRRDAASSSRAAAAAQGDRGQEIDSMLWLRQVIETGDPPALQAKQAAGRITTHRMSWRSVTATGWWLSPGHMLEGGASALQSGWTGQRH